MSNNKMAFPLAGLLREATEQMIPHLEGYVEVGQRELERLLNGEAPRELKALTELYDSGADEDDMIRAVVKFVLEIGVEMGKAEMVIALDDEARGMIDKVINIALAICMMVSAGCIVFAIWAGLS